MASRQAVERPCCGNRLHEGYFRNIYGYLCDYSHSSYAAALQVGQAQSFDEQRLITDSMFLMLNMVMAHFINVYAKLFEAAQQLLDESPEKKSVKLFAFTASVLDRY
jgi:hypothetical protein